MGVFPPQAVVKIGDTVPDIQEGLNAEMWTIGIVRSGNEVGLHADESKAMDTAELDTLYQAAASKLLAAGAHFIVDDLNACVPVLQEINAQLAQGKPNP